MTTHADWLKQSLKKEPSKFGEEVANILGFVWQGLYHLSQTSLNKVNWKDERYMTINVPYGLATWDRNELTELVVLCHDSLIRLEIRPNMRYLELCFAKRVSIEDAKDMPICKGHPTIEEQIKKIRDAK